MKRFVLVTNKKWHNQLFEDLRSEPNSEWIRISQKEEFSYECLVKLQPEYIFIPHWSYIIPPQIFENFRCVVFHMSDLPFGRGGSPLQNLIVRGLTDTKISATQVSEGIDTGDIYSKELLSLAGTAEEIFIRASKIINKMIHTIINEHLKPVPQSGSPTLFKRRKPDESNIQTLTELEQIYDYIRMLDCEGYPAAFIETEYFKFEFKRCSLKADGSIIADVRIVKK